MPPTCWPRCPTTSWTAGCATGTLTELKGIGAKTAAVASQAGKGKVPDYLDDARGGRPWAR